MRCLPHAEGAPVSTTPPPLPPGPGRRHGQPRAGWQACFRDLAARVLSSVAPVTCDAHRGLTEAIGATLPAAAWQRCRSQYAPAENHAVPSSHTTPPGRDRLATHGRRERQRVLEYEVQRHGK